MTAVEHEAEQPVDRGADQPDHPAAGAAADLGAAGAWSGGLGRGGLVGRRLTRVR